MSETNISRQLIALLLTTRLETNKRKQTHTHTHTRKTNLKENTNATLKLHF